MLLDPLAQIGRRVFVPIMVSGGKRVVHLERRGDWPQRHDEEHQGDSER
jgi:hypothetical protein